MIDEIAPECAAVLDERRELIRECALRVLENERIGRKPDPLAVEWARRFIANNPPLSRPLWPGEPK